MTKSSKEMHVTARTCFKTQKTNTEDNMTKESNTFHFSIFCPCCFMKTRRNGSHYVPKHPPCTFNPLNPHTGQKKYANQQKCNIIIVEKKKNLQILTTISVVTNLRK